MNWGQAVKKTAKEHSANKVGKVVGSTSAGFNVELEGGAVIRGASSPNEPSWPTDGSVWVTVVRSDGGWTILGRASQAPGPGLSGITD